MLLERLSRQSGLSKSQLLRFARQASKYYKVYTIRKRNGGERTIAHPTPELKATQRWLIKSIFNHFPVHASACAYERGSSIRKHAEFHLHTAFTLHVDFENFFERFRSEHIDSFLTSHAIGLRLELSPEDREFVTGIVTRYGRMTIGAPSSPRISNVLMYDFDAALSAWSAEEVCVYTRYADDIYISTTKPFVLAAGEQKIKDVSNSFSYASLKINDPKTAYLSKRSRRNITGLNITPQGQLSIGRARKRFIKSMVHRYIRDNLGPDEVQELKGLLAFASDVEPSFVSSLMQKFSPEAVERILRSS